MRIPVLRDQTGARISQIAEAYKHEAYDGVLNDILVAKLVEPFQLSKYIGIISLYDSGMDPKGKIRQLLSSKFNFIIIFFLLPNTRLVNNHLKHLGRSRLGVLIRPGWL